MGKEITKGNNSISVADDITVKLLSVKDLHSVRFMDVVSDFYVEQWLEGNTDYAWGIFKNSTNELMGYCTIGYADDIGDIIEKHPEHTDDSLLISDVYIKPKFRDRGYGTYLIKEVIRNRWKLDGYKNTVYLVVMYDKLAYFYGKIGFKPLNDVNGKFHGAMVLSVDEFNR